MSQISLSSSVFFLPSLASIIRKGPAMEHMDERLAFFLDEIQERHLPVWETLPQTGGAQELETL